MSTDTIIIGGGPAGFGAAVTAARLGANPTIIDKNAKLGGYNIVGKMSVTFNPTRGDRLCAELFDQLERGGHVIDVLQDYPEVMDNPLSHYGRTPTDFENWEESGPTHHGVNCDRMNAYNPEQAADEMHAMLDTEVIDLLFDTTVTDVNVSTTADGKRISSLTVSGGTGTREVAGDVFIDATGIGALCKMAGAPVKRDENRGGRPMPLGMQYVMENVDMERLFEYQETDPELEQAIAEAEGELDFYWDPRAGDDEAKISGLFTGHNSPEFMPLAHQGRMLHWMYVNQLKHDIDSTNKDDQERAREMMERQIREEAAFLTEYVPGYEEAQLMGISAMTGVRAAWHPVGRYTITGEDVKNYRDFGTVVSVGKEKNGRKDFHIPLGAVIAKDFENILLTGDSLSVDHTAFLYIRNFATAMHLGEVTGCIGAAAANHRLDPSELDYGAVEECVESRNLL